MTTTITKSWYTRNGFPMESTTVSINGEVISVSSPIQQGDLPITEGQYNDYVDQLEQDFDLIVSDSATQSQALKDAVRNKLVNGDPLTADDSKLIVS